MNIVQPENSSSFGLVYLPARELEVKSAWNTPDELAALDQRIRADMGKAYRLLDKINERAAELRGPAVLPKKTNRTAKQERVSRCPRCGERESA